LLYFTATETLKSIVIIDPQWLVDAMSKVIRDGKVHVNLNQLEGTKRLVQNGSRAFRIWERKLLEKMSPRKSLDRGNSSSAFERKEFKRLGLENDLLQTFQSAVASRDFLEFVWTETHADFFIELMKTTMLLSEWKSTKETKYYLIPSLLRNNFTGRVNGCRCVFDFSSNYLPNGVFPRLTCLVVRLGSSSNRTTSTEPKVYRNFSSTEVEPGHVISLLESQINQTITLFTQDEKHARNSFSIVASMLYKINSDVMNNGLFFRVYFENPKIIGNFIREDVAKRTKLFPWFSSCELAIPTEVNVDTFLAEI